MKLIKVGPLVTIICLLILSSCTKAPVASFEIDQNNVKAPATIVFTNNSTNAEEFLWNFGDGETSTEENPSHEYEQGGDYDVTLKAYGEDDTNSIVKTITILPNMTGFWNIHFMLFERTYDARLQLTELENHKLVGEFAFQDDPEYTQIDGSSLIDGYSVIIEAKLFGFIDISFKGTVNDTYDSMSGTYDMDMGGGGNWNAKKN
jgi:PKD repeat protein